MPPTVKKGQKIKFVVSSAEEAVTLIRKELGETAKVLSVKQVEGRGLAKFLTAPKLEIVAAMPEDEIAPEATPAAKKPADTKFTSEEKAMLEDSNYAPSATHAGLPSSIKTNAPLQTANKLETILRAAGFENSLLQRFKASTDWDKLQRVPIRTALADLGRRLRLDYDAVVVPPATQSIAFLGGSGVGKTTALCKHLAHEVFFERRSVQVFKLDGSTPNADNALALYCEVLGVPFIRDAKAIEPTAALLVDTSGVTLGDQDEVAALKKKLDGMGIQTRAWVVNAAYDNTVLDRSLAIAEELGATHTVYTHLDEIPSTSRLWHFVLSGRMPPLFGSTGPGITHDRAAEIGSILLQKTFPDYLLK